MAKHKHCDMIVAKAANFDLIQMIKVGDKWEVVGSHDNKTVNFGDHYDYFLCLHQHKEACFHWLNGGAAQYLSNGMEKWIDFGESSAWSITHLFMTTECEIRIKPKEEKRWIAYSTNQKRLGVLTFDSEKEARSHYIHEVEEPQFIEIEVEVNHG